MKKYTPKREEIIRDLWLKHGCPEKMKIHVRSTGETIQVLDGSVVTLTPEKNALFVRASEAKKRELMVRQPDTLTRSCKGCKNEFQARRESAQFCSTRCRIKFNRAQKIVGQRQQIEQLMAAM